IALPLSGLIAGVIGTRSQKLFKAQWKHTGDVNGHVEESFSGLDIVRAFGRDEVMLEEFDRRSESLYRASAGAQFVSGMIMPAMQFVSYLSYVLIAVAGGLRVATGQMTLGDATAFIQYSREFSSRSPRWPGSRTCCSRESPRPNGPSNCSMRRRKTPMRRAA